MPRADDDEGVDLDMLWQSLHMGHELWPEQVAWMERHGIKDQADLDTYRDARLVAHNLAAGFIRVGTQWLTAEQIAVKEAKKKKSEPASLGPLFEASANG